MTELMITVSTPASRTRSACWSMSIASQAKKDSFPVLIVRALRWFAAMICDEKSHAR